MFATEIKKVIALLFLVSFSIGCTDRTALFDRAISQARSAGLTDVSKPDQNVPFYALGTLDPVWGASSNRSIVRLDQLDLIDQEGRRFEVTNLDGKLTFVAFFFTSCAGFCPTLIKSLQSVERELRDFPSARFLAISVDPEVDQPERMRAYAKKMKLDLQKWTLLTGDRTYIYHLAHKTFAAEAFRLPKSKGQYAHSEHFYVFDNKRRLRGVLKGTRLDVAQKALTLAKELDSTKSERSALTAQAAP